MSAHLHHVFGLTLGSALPCPELPRAPAGSTPQVRVELARLPAGAATQTVGPGCYEFAIRDVARYRVERGERILVDPEAGASEGDVRLWLLGTALGALLHQRGLLPLHASALVSGGRAYAFCGVSGAGKSTLAAALHRRGLELLTDDVGLVVPESEAVWFHPGFPRIKLWRDALGHFGLDTAPLTRDFSRADKFHLRLEERFQTAARPLRHVYLLERAEDDRVSIEPLRGHLAIATLREHTYRPGLVRRIGRPAEHLRQCGRIAERVRLFRFRRPWRLERLDEALDALLAHLQAEGSS